MLHKLMLYFPHCFERHRGLLRAVTSNGNKGACEDWPRLFVGGGAEVSVQAAETTGRILTLCETHRNLIDENLGYSAGNGHRMLDVLTSIRSSRRTK